MTDNCSPVIFLYVMTVLQKPNLPQVQTYTLSQQTLHEGQLTGHKRAIFKSGDKYDITQVRLIFKTYLLGFVWEQKWTKSALLWSFFKYIEII